MAVLSSLDAKTIDELRELGKLYGNEKTIVSDGTDTRKVSIDTIIGYAASRIANVPVASSTNVPNMSGSQNITFIPEGKEVPINERVPGSFYLEERSQTSIRTNISAPASMVVSKSLGLRRV